MGRGLEERLVDGRQVRAARVLLGWNQATLADRARISLPTVKRLEADVGDVSAASLSTVVAALGSAGVLFLGPGAIGSVELGEGGPILTGVALVGRS